MSTVGRQPLGVSSLDTHHIGIKRNRRTIKKYELLARLNELCHAPFTVYFGYKLAEDLGKKDYGNAIGDGIGLLINGYCIMLQRYNRARVYNTLDVLNEQSDKIKTEGAEWQTA